MTSRGVRGTGARQEAWEQNGKWNRPLTLRNRKASQSQRQTRSGCITAEALWPPTGHSPSEGCRSGGARSEGTSSPHGALHRRPCCCRTLRGLYEAEVQVRIQEPIRVKRQTFPGESMGRKSWMGAAVRH